MAYKMDVSFKEVMDIYNKNHKIGNKEGLKKAYDYACEKHKDMVRGTGEPYIFHPLRVARYLAEWGFESDVIMAALLHDVVEDCDTPLSEIKHLFGSNVADLVDTVTKLTDKDFTDQTLSKRQIDILSDARLQKKMNIRALYVKIADRLDNLNTISGVREDRRILKAEHTREIIIPMARLIRAYYFVDCLEELCFKTEHQKLHADITRKYQQLLTENDQACQKTLGFLTSVFGPEFDTYMDSLPSGSSDSPDTPWAAGPEDLIRCHSYIIGFMQNKRSCISIFRQVLRSIDNIRKELPAFLTKRNIPLYDLTLIVSSSLSSGNSRIRPEDIFFRLFDSLLSPKGFCLIRYCLTSYEDAGYFILMDDADNMYRFFVRTELEYQRYLYGSIVDEDNSLTISHINELDPRETYNEKIKVFRRDSSAMYIDKGSTVLDFAFHIHSQLGYHFKYALIDESKTQLPLHTRLNEGDTITIVAHKDITPDITWFRHVKTRQAVNYLVHYFQIHGLEPKNPENPEE